MKYFPKTSIKTFKGQKVILIPLLLLLSCSSHNSEEKTPPKKPVNVLFIMVDDLNNDLGCYGNPVVQTPHIDRLASQGIRFDRIYSQLPVCGPSRVSLLTSLRPDSTKVIINETDFRDHVPTVVTLPQLFKNNGYFTARVGKIFHYGVPFDIGTNGLDDSLSWQERYNPIGIDKAEEDSLINLTPQKNIGTALAYHATEESDSAHTDGLVTQRTIDLLEKHRDEPFFIAAGFFRPHVPFIAPEKYFNLYDTEDISVREEPENDREDIPEMALFTTQKPDFGLTIGQQKQAIKSYYACISFIDAQVGMLMEALERLELADNTLVVFVSDHGYSLGEHGLWEKMNLFEEATRVPMIIRAPHSPPSTHSTQGLVEMLDIYPTLAEYCGIEAPDYLHGTSFVPLLQNPDQSWKSAAISEVGRLGTNKFDLNKLNGGFQLMGRSVRTEEWRYTEWQQGNHGSELYNHRKDSQEYINLTLSPEYQGIKKKLTTHFEKLPKLEIGNR